MVIAAQIKSPTSLISCISHCTEVDALVSVRLGQVYDSFLNDHPASKHFCFNPLNHG